MSGNLLSENTTITCTHGGTVGFVPGSGRVQVRGRPVATIADHYTVTGCPFSTSAGPHPCSTVNWQNPATRVRVNGSPVLLRSSAGLTQAADQAPQGLARVSAVGEEVTAR
jgi:hypothetical protein